MPRDLPLGNGDFLVNFDARYQLRDIFYPNVGLENHTVGEPSRFAIWVDGQFAWTGDDGWERHINYEHETLVVQPDLVHAKLGVSLHFRDAVDFDRNLYFKEVTVEDTSGKDRQVRLFQHFDAHLLERHRRLGVLRPTLPGRGPLQRTPVLPHFGIERRERIR